MFSSQWIEIIEGYLGWKGLASGCYYFQAHMSDIDRNKEGLIAKYTPISIDDLMEGAFDIEWFKFAYKSLERRNLKCFTIALSIFLMVLSIQELECSLMLSMVS